MSKYCKHCSILNPDEAKFCRNCGKPFLASVQPAVPKSTTPTPPTSNSDGGDVFFKIFGTIVVIGICIAIVVCTGGIGTPVVLGAFWGIKSIWD